MLEYMRVRRIFVYDSNTPSNIPLTKEKKTSNVYETVKWDGYTYIYIIGSAGAVGNPILPQQLPAQSLTKQHNKRQGDVYNKHYDKS